MHGSLGWCEVHGARGESTIARLSAGFTWETGLVRGAGATVYGTG